MIYKGPVQGWRQYQSRYCMQGVICKKCKKSFYPCKYLCICGSTEFEDHNFNGTGTLISFTNISSPSEEFKKSPVYCIGLLQLDDGPVIMAQLADVKVEELKIGTRFKSVFRKFYSNEPGGVVEYGLKFIPDNF